MWLWTLKTAEIEGTDGEDGEEASGDEEEGSGKKGGGSGYVLEFDAARKIAQGLGAHLETLTSVVEVSGETARLLSVAERASFLFSKQKGVVSQPQPSRKNLQKKLFGDDSPAVSAREKDWLGDAQLIAGRTILDRVHQAMLLFGNGRSEALRRFLVEAGFGNSPYFWRLAQALSALYPSGSDEKRWVDGLLARKKGLGL
jgi:hypothetical protein